ncbi:MAG: C-GCAxxG-C-C family protein [Defluviitaleaceae bacterium]|nr:C-GCAxxG-C-C family protein [Defluviitaleaceae bacterium]
MPKIKRNVSKEIDIAKVRKDAMELFANGSFLCSEAVVYSLKQNVDPTMSDAFVSSASGFSRGVGGSSCMCAAVTGAVVALGYFFGRTTPTTITDPESLKSLALAFELQEEFKKNNKSLCCHVHMKIADKAQVSHMNKCVNFVGDAAASMAKIVAREYKASLINEEVHADV